MLKDYFKNVLANFKKLTIFKKIILLFLSLFLISYLILALYSYKQNCIEDNYKRDIGWWTDC